MCQKKTLRTVMLTCLILATSSPAFSQSVYQPREDKGIKDLGMFFKTFGRDAIAVSTRPLRMSRRNWATTGATAIVFTALYQNDPETHDWSQRNKNDGLLRVLHDTGESLEVLGLMGKTGRYYAATLALGYTFNWTRLERASTDILFSHFIGGLIRRGFVQFVDRSRPNEDLGTYHYGDGGTSLPSGHSSTVFQLATVLSHHYPRWWAQVAFYTAATCVGVQRVTTAQHYASDSFLGAAWGIAVGRIVVGANDRNGYLLSPVVSAAGTPGLGISVLF